MPWGDHADPIFPSNASIAFDEDEIDRMWEVHEEALADQTKSEWNPNNLFLLPFALLRWAFANLEESWRTVSSPKN